MPPVHHCLLSWGWKLRRRSESFSISEMHLIKYVNLTDGKSNASLKRLMKMRQIFRQVGLQSNEISFHHESMSGRSSNSYICQVSCSISPTFWNKATRLQPAVSIQKTTTFGFHPNCPKKLGHESASSARN